MADRVPERGGSTPEFPYYDPTLNPIGKPSFPDPTHEGVFSVPISIPKDKDLDLLHLQTQQEERRRLRKFLLMEDRKQGQVYYDPTMNPPELPDPNPLNDRLAEKAARNPNEPKTEPLDNYLTRVSE